MLIIVADQSPRLQTKLEYVALYLAQKNPLMIKPWKCRNVVAVDLFTHLDSLSPLHHFSSGNIRKLTQNFYLYYLTCGNYTLH